MCGLNSTNTNSNNYKYINLSGSKVFSSTVQMSMVHRLIVLDYVTLKSFKGLPASVLGAKSPSWYMYGRREREGGRKEES